MLLSFSQFYVSKRELFQTAFCMINKCVWWSNSYLHLQIGILKQLGFPVYDKLQNFGVQDALLNCEQEQAHFSLRHDKVLFWLFSCFLWWICSSSWGKNTQIITVLIMLAIDTKCKSYFRSDVGQPFYAQPPFLTVDEPF